VPDAWSRTSGFVRKWWTLDNRHERVDAQVGPIDPALVPMLRQLGIAMLDGGEATNDVEDKLYEIARAYSRNPIRIVVLPTVLILQIEGESGTATELDESAGRPMRLDQFSAVSKLVDEARTGEPQPAAVIERLHAILVGHPRFRGWSRVVGHAVLTLGFGLALNPSASALPAYVILGGMVGVLLLVGQRFATLSTAMPVIAAFMVTVITASFLAEALGAEPIRVITPPLVSFLPGMTLTIAAAELTNRQIIAGSSRLVYGGAQLMLLVFGVVMGLAVVGNLVDPTLVADQLGWWAPWLAVFVITVGFVLFQSAPSGSFAWILLMLLITTVAQRAGNNWLTPALSGFVGALVIVPVSRALARIPAAPPATMLAFPAFLLLVPGALGFIGLNQAVTGAAQSVETLVQTGLSFFAIAIGMVFGAGITRDIAAARTTWRETA
jgi:uncharacterized membrane protein YjjP (DUF1212 family)